ncbi:MAG TPA: 2-phospho-L-lactate guanylyltransferase [Micropepsaceae bacterium]|nr:2-phospho-L-lactate guanylyltransferase [Micropepsaceae bacterium]
MKAILIPVKTFRDSKTRLAPHFSADARAALADALCEDFFRVVAHVTGATRVFVASHEPVALERARSHGWDIIVETEQISESRSVDAASRFCEAQGVNALLRLPMDLPLITADDIDALLAESENPPFTLLVPSHDGTGTNALLRSAPTLFPSHFGPNSLARHLEEAERRNARVKILRNANIGYDVDELADLRAVAGRMRHDSATARWILRHRP